MAKKIILAFNSALEIGTGSNFEYQIQINGIPIVYSNGNNSVNIGFNDTGDIPPYEIKKYADLKDNVSKVLDYLTQYHSSPILTYTRLENTIEIFIDSETAIVYGLYSANTGITVKWQNVNIVIEGEIKLKYFFQYKNNVDDDYRFEIYQVGYTGDSKEISGRAVINKARVNDHLSPVRGTSVSVTLEADKTLNLEDLFSQNELDFPVKFYKNNKLIFRGFLNPDGVFQSFTRSIWNITVDCVDGLGAIDNLSFVKDNGITYLGKMSGQDLVFNCLRRTGMLQKINTSINVFYDGFSELPNRNILQSIFMNTDRFIKTDDNTIMSCGNVLRSILDLFDAVITQEEGEWYIYKPNEVMQNNGYVEFKKYGISNTYESTFTRNMNRKLGSQIDNYYPHHCSENQQIRIKGGISAFRINYKYGFLAGLIPNADLIHDTSLNYNFWEKEDFTNVINDPLASNGIKVRTIVTANGHGVIKSFPLAFKKDDILRFKVKYEVTTIPTGVVFVIKQGNYKLRFSKGINNGVSEWQLANVFTSFTKTYIKDPAGAVIGGTDTFTLDFAPLMEDGDLTIELIQPANGTILAEDILNILKIDIQNIGIENNNVVGEFNTVQRKNGVSSIVKENKEIYNGDNGVIAYVGAIYKLDQNTLTDKWHRKNFVESKPILQIAAEDALRISQKPAQTFSGSFFGYMPFLSLVEINNLKGRFMAIEYSYDTFENIGTQTLLEVFSSEIPDIDYKFTLDFGETVKPTITS